jgi:hypothetical protein
MHTVLVQLGQGSQFGELHAVDRVKTKRLNIQSGVLLEGLDLGFVQYDLGMSLDQQSLSARTMSIFGQRYRILHIFCVYI